MGGGAQENPSTAGVHLRIFVLEGQRHHGQLLYEWLLQKAEKMGIPGGSAFREIAGFGRHHRMHDETFFELAGELPVEVMFAMSESETERFLAVLESERLSLFYVKSQAEFGRTGDP